LPVLIARLGDRRGRGAVRSALLAIGEAAQTALAEALAAKDTAVPIRLHIPRSIALFRNPQAAHFLLEHLQREPSGAVRYRGLQVLARLAVDERIRLPREPLIERLAVNLREHFRLLSLLEPLGRGTYELPPEAVESADLLRGLLEDKRHQSLGRCFLLLQIAHPREDIRGIEAAVAGGDRRTRANGLEFVDNLTIGYRRHARGAEVHELLRLALDDLPIPAKLERAGPTVSSRTLTYDQAVLALAKDEDETTAAIATYHALLLDVPHLRAEVAIMCRARPLIEKVGPELQRLITGESNA
jgi:hypothetical protein